MLIINSTLDQHSRYSYKEDERATREVWSADIPNLYNTVHYEYTAHP